MADQIILELTGGRIERAGRTLLDQVSFQIKSGECIVLSGPNGSGKSTLLMALAGEKFLSEGELKFNGQSIGSFTIKELAEIRSVMLQADEASDQLLASDVLELAAQGKSATESDQEFVSGLVPSQVSNSRILNLSVGQRAKVFLAAAVLQNSDLLILDEPTAALDNETVAALATFISNRISLGKSVLVVTHDERIMKVATRRFAVTDAKKLELIS